MQMVFDLIKEIMQSNVNFIVDEQRLRPANSEVFRLWGDNSIISSLTTWKPITTIKSGLQETITWLLIPDNLKKYKTAIYNV